MTGVDLRMPAWVEICVLNEPDLENPTLIQGLPGLGFVGKIAVDYLIEELKPKSFAELYSTYLAMPDGSLGIQVNSDGTYTLPKFEFYAYTHSKPHLILLTGNMQPVASGQYEVMDSILDFVQRYGCKRVIAVGGFRTHTEQMLGQVYGVFSDERTAKEVCSLGVSASRGGSVTGACGLILGLGWRRKLNCIGLLGATKGEYPDALAAKAVIDVVARLVGLQINFRRLDDEIENLRAKLEIINKLQSASLKKVLRDEKESFYV
ncbi:MAG: PAC2 family protein [Candidatus Bathyarchaeia archaeon]